MFTFSKALLTATYKNGKIGQRTEVHEKAELHRFKTELLFKNKIIPKDLYTLRLIQYFFIINAIETQLKTVAKSEELNAFFTLSYLESLWRTSGITEDLRQLGVDTSAIPKSAITQTTERYLDDLQKLKPKELLAHFLMHVAGFMHGGKAIQIKYIEPSNRLTTSYQISTNQYDFSSASTFLSSEKNSTFSLYDDMMKTVDKIALDTNEYEEIFEQCNNVYATMVNIYDNLYDMYTYEPNGFGYSFVMLTIILAILSTIIFSLISYLSPDTEHRSFGPS